MTADQKLMALFYETIGNKVNGQLIDIVDGPQVHNFIVKPSDKSNMTTINKIARDNKYMVVYGDDNVIVQIPKENRNTVLLQDLIKSKDFKDTDATLSLVMGVDTFGKIIIQDLRKMPHLLVSGRTGCGKSVFINCVLESLKAKLSSTECRFIIIDTKGVDFDSWDGEKHLMCPVVRLDIDETFQKLQEVLQIMDERYQKLQDNKVKNVEEYRQKTNKTDMPYIIVAIDEFADLICTDKKQTETFVKAITNKARAVGIHLIMATQRLDKDVLTSTIKANMPSRIAFQARNKADSIQMIDESGAECLTSYADMLYSDAGRLPVRIHTPFIEGM